MTRLQLPEKYYGELPLDLCFACRGIWFDRFESEQLTPGSIIELFRLIHAHRNDLCHSITATLRCPRCQDTLKQSLDVSRNGRFTYHRCLQNHGRFTAFAQFMIEKGFVRQLSPAEIRAVAARIHSVHCTGCNAPVDIRHDSACTHCGAPIAILDPDAVEKALAIYHTDEIRRTRRDPEALAEALLAVERQRSTTSHAVPGVADMVLSGIGVALDFLER